MRVRRLTLALGVLIALSSTLALAAPPTAVLESLTAGLLRPPPKAEEPAAAAEAPAAPSPAVRERPAFDGHAISENDPAVVQEVLRLLRRDSVHASRMARERTYSSVEDVLTAAGDPWTRFVGQTAHPSLAAAYDARDTDLDLDDLDMLDDEQEAATYGALGISLGWRGQTPVVMGVVAHGPAWLAGLRAGDRIVAVHGVSATAQSPSRLYHQLVHRAADVVPVEVERGGWTRPYVLEAAPPALPAVVVRAIQDDVAYAHVPLFTTYTATEIDHGLAELERRGTVRGLVLDLRGNPGGRLHLAIETAELFVGLGLLARVEERASSLPQYCVTADTPRSKMALVVLVDEGTGGVAEIVSAGLKENGRALLVGAKTAGKGTVYQTATLSDGSELHMTTGHAFTPSGLAIDGAGVEPDVAVAMPRMDDEQLIAFRMGGIVMRMDGAHGTPGFHPDALDAQLKRAIELVKNGSADPRKLESRRRVRLPTDAEVLE